MELGIGSSDRTLWYIETVSSHAGEQKYLCES